MGKKDKISASPALARLAASTDVYVDADGHLRARPPRGLTAAQGTWKRIVPPDDVKRDVRLEQLRNAIYDDRRAALTAAIGKPSKRSQQSRRRTMGRKAGR